MKCPKIALPLFLLAWPCLARATEPTNLPFDTYSGYFVSNRFEPDAAQSFLVIASQKQFDKVFGVAVVMGDKSHRLPTDTIKSNVVLAVAKRGKAVWEFEVHDVTVDSGVVRLRYTTTSKESESATFACPLIVSIPKGEYKAVEFVEDKKTVEVVEMKVSADQDGCGGESPARTHEPNLPKHDLQKSVQDSKLRKELLVRMAEDQAARKHLLDLLGRQEQSDDIQEQIRLAKTKLRDIDRKNLVRMKEIIGRSGWPGRTPVGLDGSQAAWLLVQHADSDLDFQKQCLVLITSSVEKGESLPEHMAYLTDRVLIAEGRKQVYGTQFHDVNGKQEPYPGESEADLDCRRNKVGLPPMVDYRKSIEKMYQMER